MKTLNEVYSSRGIDHDGSVSWNSSLLELNAFDCRLMGFMEGSMCLLRQTALKCCILGL